MRVNETLVAINIAVAEELSTPFSIRRPHDITLINKRYEQLNSKDRHYRDAYIANAVVQLKPFETGNLRTALLWLMASHPLADATTLAGLLKHGSDTGHIATSLEAK